MLRLCYVLLLCYCLVVQHNDVDALLWMVLYGAAVITILLSRASLQLLVAVVAVLGLFWLGAPLMKRNGESLGDCCWLLLVMGCYGTELDPVRNALQPDVTSLSLGQPCGVVKLKLLVFFAAPRSQNLFPCTQKR